MWGRGGACFQKWATALGPPPLRAPSGLEGEAGPVSARRTDSVPGTPSNVVERAGSTAGAGALDLQRMLGHRLYKSTLTISKLLLTPQRGRFNIRFWVPARLALSPASGCNSVLVPII